MNRKARRAALKGGSGSAGSHSYSSRDIEQLAARAGGLFREGRFEQVQDDKVRELNKLSQTGKQITRRDYNSRNLAELYAELGN